MKLIGISGQSILQRTNSTLKNTVSVVLIANSWHFKHSKFKRNEKQGTNKKNCEREWHFIWFVHLLCVCVLCSGFSIYVVNNVTFSKHNSNSEQQQTSIINSWIFWVGRQTIGACIQQQKSTSALCSLYLTLTLSKIFRFVDCRGWKENGTATKKKWHNNNALGNSSVISSNEMLVSLCLYSKCYTWSEKLSTHDKDVRHSDIFISLKIISCICT